MTNNYGENVNGNTTTNTGSGDGEGWKSITPTTVEDDEELLAALNGDLGEEQGDRSLNLDTGSWGGMESGAINYKSTQEEKWIDTVPKQYQSIASKWQKQ